MLARRAGDAVGAVPASDGVGGQPVVTLTSPYAIAACALDGRRTPPCVTGQFVGGRRARARRRRAGRAHVSQSVCVPTGTPMLPLVAQTRVLAT